MATVLRGGNIGEERVFFLRATVLSFQVIS